MKIAIIGCSHSAGNYYSNPITGRVALDHESGYIPYLAKIFPQHDFHSFSTPGTGYMIQKIAINEVYERGYDMVIIQLTDIRSTFSIYNTDDTFNNGWLFKEKKHIDNYKMFTLHLSDAINVSHPNLNFLDVNIPQQDPNYNFRGSARGAARASSKKIINLLNNRLFSDLVLDTNSIFGYGFKYWMLNLPDYLNNMFEHFFILDWSSNYYCNTVLEDVARRDFKESVFEWFEQKLMTNNKLTEGQATALANRITRPHGGHLPITYQYAMVDEILLKNERFVNLLD